jgi:ankyrin repeat protein
MSQVTNVYNTQVFGNLAPNQTNPSGSNKQASDTSTTELQKNAENEGLSSGNKKQKPNNQNNLDSPQFPTEEKKTSIELIEATCHVWIAYRNNDCIRLTQLAKKPDTNFGILSQKTGKTIFHKCVDHGAVNELQAIYNGARKANPLNSSIKEVVNKLWNHPSWWLAYGEKTPLYMAAESGTLSFKGTQRKIVELLLALGADPNIKCCGKLPIEIAPNEIKLAFNPDLLSCISNAEFDEAVIRIGNICKHPNIKNILSELRDESGNNGMLLAITKGKAAGKSEALILKVITALQECGDDINHKNVYKETVLSLAVMNGYRQILAYLLSIEPIINCSLSTPDGTIIHLAAQCNKNDVDMLELLISKHPKLIDFKNKFGKTPLHLVNNIEAVNILCIKGADVTLQDHNNYSPIEIAAKKDEKLADWMRLYDRNLSAKQKAQIINKHNWMEQVKGIIPTITHIIEMAASSNFTTPIKGLIDAYNLYNAWMKGEKT